MKVQCDVCEKAPATLICCADEAALCASCDVEVHAANKLASKHQRLLLHNLSNKLPRCDICQEKAAFIFCVEDRALFCRECDEPIHVAGTLSGEHRRYLATGIRVALNTMCGKEPHVANSEPANHNPSVAAPKVSSTEPDHTQTFANSAWSVDDFLQLSDYESADKLQKESSGGFGELEWFSGIGVFDDQMRKDGLTAAEVPQLHTSQSSSDGFYRNNKSSMASKKQKVGNSGDDEEFFTVPDLG